MGKKIYGEEFKLEALKLVRERGISIAQAARELGIKQQTLQRWKQLQDQGKGVVVAAGAATCGTQRSQSQELERLRRENVRLRAERDILKKGSS